MPPNIAKWLYQGLADVLVAFQTVLNGGGAFNAAGAYVTETGQPASGGEVVAWWGTELGSRREQAIIAWDYDVDLAVFVSPGVDIDSLWRQAKSMLEPLGLRGSQVNFGERAFPSFGFAQRVVPVSEIKRPL